MKHLSTLLFIVVCLSVSCKKDKKEYKPLDQTLISTTWLTTSEKYVYYNESILPLFEQNNPVGMRYVFNETSKTARVTDLNGNVVNKSYSLFRVNGKNFINITLGENTETYQITSYTDKTMSWRQEKTNQTYEGGKVAAKSLATIEFHCPCRD